MRFDKRTGFISRLLNTSRINFRTCKRYFYPFLGICALALMFMIPPPKPFHIGRIFGMIALAAAGAAMMRAHISEWPMESWRKPKVPGLLWLASILAVGGVQLARILLEKRAMDSGLGFVSAAPLIASALLIGALLTPTAASSFTTLIAMGCAVSGVLDLKFAAAAWAAGIVGAHVVSPLKHRTDLLRTGNTILLLYVGAAVALGSIEGSSWQAMGRSAAWAAAASVGAMALFWLGVALLERAFDLVTDWGLLELCSPDNPLLRDLCTTAPGTYQHSIMVANLGEAAAKAIGANSLLTRVAAYYHDIGKLKRPDFFIENQSCVNVHDRLVPSLSAMIIAAHVKDGLELADEHNLPQPVKDIIAQHHGTSLITYFYHQATAGNEQHDPVLEQHYRYSGPNPRTKEAAIILLADTIEAASRTLDRTSPARLENFILQLVENRRSDGQLDESDLSFRDLRKIVESFVQTLTASRHQRIDYPEVALQDVPASEERDTNLEPLGI